MTKFVKAQFAYDPRFGFGVIREIDLTKKRPVIVDFFNDTIEYTLDGKENSYELIPMLYHDKVEIK
jgi:hypothetical protein